MAEIRDVSLRFSSLEQKVEIKDEENISDPFIVNVDNLPTEKDKEQFLFFKKYNKNLNGFQNTELARRGSTCFSRSSFFLKRSSTVETEDTTLEDDDEDQEKQSKSLGNIHYGNFKSKLGRYSSIVNSEQFPFVATIISESSLDPATPVQRRESLSSLGSLLDDLNDEDLEKTNATLVAVLTVAIVLFFVLIFSLIFIVAVSLPPVHQGEQAKFGS